LLCAGADEINVGAFFEDETCGLNGIAEALNTGDATGFHAATVHQEGVKLNTAVGSKEAAATGVEGGVIFENGDSGFDGVESGAAEGEDLVASFEGVADAYFMVGRGVGGNGPGATVDQESGIVGCWGCHGDMVAQRAGIRDEGLATGD
jgi:hypothetical protein